MAVPTHGGVLPDNAQKADFYALIDNGTVTGIVNADISNSAAIDSSKLAQITTASKVSGTALTGLGSTPSAAGTLPSANGGTAADLSAAAQGAIPYFASTGVMAALAAGTLGYYLKAGGAGANPVWTVFPSTGLNVAANVNGGGFDPATVTGNTSVTGFGFIPKAIIFITSQDGTSHISFGISTGTSAGKNMCLYQSTSGAWQLLDYNGTSIGMQYRGASDYTAFTIVSFDAGGFTYRATKNGSPTGNAVISYLAIG